MQVSRKRRQRHIHDGVIDNDKEHCQAPHPEDSPLMIATGHGESTSGLCDNEKRLLCRSNVLIVV